MRGAGARATSVNATSNGAEVVGRPVEPRQPSGIYVLCRIARSAIIDVSIGREGARGEDRGPATRGFLHASVLSVPRNENVSRKGSGCRLIRVRRPHVFFRRVKSNGESEPRAPLSSARCNVRARDT